MARNKDQVDLDELIPYGDPSPRYPIPSVLEWTPDERRQIRLAALAIERDQTLTLDEKYRLTVALIMKPLRREGN